MKLVLAPGPIVFHPFGGTPLFAFEGFKLFCAVGGADLELDGIHVRMHVGEIEVEPVILVEIEELDSHRAPRGTAERFRCFVAK